MITVIKHAPHEGLGTLEESLRESGQELKIVEAYHTGPEEMSRSWALASKADILIVMGGAMGVYEADRHPFLRAELKLLEARVNRDAPTLGICLGSQLIAAAAGATVKASGKHEIGWYHVRPTDEGRKDSLLRGLEWTEPVFHWHGDTFETPRGGVRLLESDRFPQQGFRLGRQIYGLQFHPEVPSNDLPAWIDSEPDMAYGKVDGVQSREEILHGGEAWAGPMAGLAATLVRRLLTDVWT